MSTEAIDKGTLIIENEEDKKTVSRYLKALAEGDETYQPPNLKKIPPGQKQQKTGNKQNSIEEQVFRDNRANINYI